MADHLVGFDHDALSMTKGTIQRTAAMTPPEAMEVVSDHALVMRAYEP